MTNTIDLNHMHNTRARILNRLSSLIVSGRISVDQYYKRVNAVNKGTLRRIAKL